MTAVGDILLVGMMLGIALSMIVSIFYQIIFKAIYEEWKENLYKEFSGKNSKGRGSK